LRRKRQTVAGGVERSWTLRRGRGAAGRRCGPRGGDAGGGRWPEKAGNAEQSGAASGAETVDGVREGGREMEGVTPALPTREDRTRSHVGLWPPAAAGEGTLTAVSAVIAG
jgi:hypothetical protein